MIAMAKTKTKATKAQSSKLVARFHDVLIRELDVDGVKLSVQTPFLMEQLEETRTIFIEYYARGARLAATVELVRDLDVRRYKEVTVRWRSWEPTTPFLAAEFSNTIARAAAMSRILQDILDGES